MKKWKPDLLGNGRNGRALACHACSWREKSWRLQRLFCCCCWGPPFFLEPMASQPYRHVNSLYGGCWENNLIEVSHGFLWCFLCCSGDPGLLLLLEGWWWYSRSSSIFFGYIPLSFIPFFLHIFAFNQLLADIKKKPCHTLTAYWHLREIYFAPNWALF